MNSRRRWILFSGLASFFLSIMMLYQMTPFFQTYAQETAGVDDGTVGLIFAMLPMATLAGYIPANYAISVYGTRLPLAAGLLGLAAGSLMFGLSDSAFWWLLWRAVQGLAAAPVNTAITVMFANTFHGPGEFARVNSLQEGMSNIAFAGGPALGGFLFQCGGFLAPFAFSAAGHVLFVVLSLWVPSEGEEGDDIDDTLGNSDQQEPLVDASCEDESDLEPASMWSVMTSEVLLIVPAACCVAGIFGALDPVLPRHLHHTLGALEPSTIGFIISIMSWPTISLAVITPYLMEMTSGHTVMTTGVGLMAAACVLLGLSDPDAEALVGYSLQLEVGSSAQWALQISIFLSLGVASALGWTPVLPDMMEKSAARVARDRGISRRLAVGLAATSVSTLFSVCGSLGEALGPLLGGMLSSRFGFSGTFIIIGGAFGAYFVVLLLAPWARIQVYTKTDVVIPKALHYGPHTLIPKTTRHSSRPRASSHHSHDVAVADGSPFRVMDRAVSV